MGARRHVLLWTLAFAPGCAARSTGTAEGSSHSPDAASARAPEPVPGQLTPIRVGGARLDVIVDGDTLQCTDEELRAWVSQAAEDVAAYFGRFPVPDLRITIAARRGGAIGFGQHWDGKFLRINVGPEADARAFARDWVLVHEMLHTGFPDLERRHKWMQEGLSTYLERVVQAQNGHWSERDLWLRWLRSLPIGRPRPGDRGFDHTRRWSTLYWGGALYWFLVDYELRKQTDNRKSLRDALIGILDAGGNGRAQWSTAQVIAAGDAATNTTVLGDLYARLATGPAEVDLDAIFADLGVSLSEDDEVVFDEDAPDAAIRRAMTRR